jgi:hypothetical protein
VTKFIAMPSGDQFRSDYILAVEAKDGQDGDKVLPGYIEPRVIVHLLGGDRRWYETATFEKACQLRDKIMKEVLS